MSRPGATRPTPWMIPGLLVTICIVLSFSGPTQHLALDFTREGIAAGRYWQLLAAHAMHVDASHAALNIAALVLVAWTFSRDLAGPGAQLFVLACGTCAIDTGLWFLHPEVRRYVGLSGLLHAWFAAGVISWLACALDRPVDRGRVAWGAVLTIALAAKLFVEARELSFWNAGLDIPIVTAAHRWGALGGVVAGATLAWWRRRSRA